MALTDLDGGGGNGGSDATLTPTGGFNISGNILDFLPPIVKSVVNSIDDFFSADDRAKAAALQQVVNEYEKQITFWRLLAIALMALVFIVIIGALLVSLRRR